MPSIFHHIHNCKHILDHIRFRKTELNTELTLIGSVIVDLENVGVIKKVHGRCHDFLVYLLKHDRKYAPLAVGMLIHELFDNTVEPKYVHKKEKAAGKLLKEHDPFSASLPLAEHIFIEHCLDCALVDEKPELFDLIKYVKQKIKKKHMRRIAFHLANFFDGNSKTIYTSLEQFKGFDLSKFKTIQGRSSVWQHFMFLYSQRELLHHKQNGFFRRIYGNIKLIVKYIQFWWGMKHDQIQLMMKKAKHEFRDHIQIVERAHGHITRKLRRHPTLKVLRRGFN
jgi:hypothetical protein